MDLYSFTSRLAADGLATFMFSRDSDWMEVGLPRQPPPEGGVVGTEVAGRNVILRETEWPDRRVWVADPAAVYACGNRWSFTNEGFLCSGESISKKFSATGIRWTRCTSWCGTTISASPSLFRGGGFRCINSRTGDFKRLRRRLRAPRSSRPVK